MLNPTLYAVLLDRATDAPAESVKERLDEALRAMTAGLAPQVLEALRYAYADGLRDGFAQGIAAATDEATPDEPGNQETTSQEDTCSAPRLN